MSIENIAKRYEDQKLQILSRKEESLVALVEPPGKNKKIIRIYKREMPVYQALENHNCPGLPKIYGYSREQDCFVVEEEWIDGICIQEILEGGGRLEPQRALAVMEDVCKPLKYIHAMGFIHRDIKPEHVMLTADGNVFLIDLDAAMRVQKEKKNDTQLLGTTGYAAPEQFGLVRSDARTDIYAMGILLNTMLTGEHPTVNLYREGLASDIIAKCTSLSPADRYQSVEELEKAIGKAYLETIKRPDMMESADENSLSATGASAGSSDGMKAQAKNQDAAGVKTGRKSGTGEKPERKSFAKKAGVAVLICAVIAAGGFALSGRLSDDGKDPQVLAGTETDVQTEQDDRPRNEDGSLVLPEGYEQMYFGPGGENDTTFYSFRQGSRVAILGTDEVKIDDTYEMSIDKNVGRITNYDKNWGSWVVSSENCEVGEQGFLYAEKGEEKYAVQVLTMGEPISAYTKIPDIRNLKDGYIKPGKDMYLPEERVIRMKYEAGKPVELYLAAMMGFDNLQPTCDSDLVRIQLDDKQKQWPWNVFLMTFDNPEGGDVTLRVPNQDTSLTFVFEEA